MFVSSKLLPCIHPSSFLFFSFFGLKSNSVLLIGSSYREEAMSDYLPPKKRGKDFKKKGKK